LVEFLALAVENAMSELKSRSAGGMFESLTAAGLKGLPLSIPPLAEQRRIVDLIGAVDEATAPAAAAWSAMGDSLTSIATSLYEQAPGRKKITETCDLLVGFAFRSTTFTDDERCVRLLRGDNIIPGGLRWKGVQRFNGEIGEILDRYLLEAGDIVLAMDRPVINGGVKVARVEEGDVPSLLVQRVARLRPRDPGMTPLLHALLVAAPFQSYLEAVQTGGHAPHISAGLIRDFDVPDLNEESASIASGVLGALLEAERAATLEYKRLLMLRSALLSDLLSGSHEIPASYDSLLEMVS
jgi:type I restriction enzyme S subunit